MIVPVWLPLRRLLLNGRHIRYTGGHCGIRRQTVDGHIVNGCRIARFTAHIQKQCVVAKQQWTNVDQQRGRSLQWASNECTIELRTQHTEQTEGKDDEAERAKGSGRNEGVG